MIRQYRKQWLKWHDGYERTARIIFQNTFKEIAKDIPFDRMSVGTYKSYLQTHVSKEKIFDSYTKVYSEVGIKHGKRVGVQINKQINQKNFSVDGFLNEFQRTLINFLVTNEGSRITTVRQSYIQFLTQIMTKGIAEGKTISMIATDMTKLIKSRNFYRWQSLRIARTETTAASNYAATVSSSVSGVLMDKVWISALDERTRQGTFNHLEMNQKRVALDKPFNVSGQNLMFPGDPKGSAGNVINCRCSVAQVVRRDADGNIMRIEDVGAPIRDINTGISVFRTARTLQEAEEYVIKNGIAKKVNYSKVTLEQANEANRVLSKIHKGKALDSIDFNDIVGDNQFIQGVYKYNDNAILLRNDLKIKLSKRELERGSIDFYKKKLKEAKDYLKTDPNNKEAIRQVKALQSRVDNWARETTGTTLEDVLTHEYGHKLDYNNLKTIDEFTRDGYLANTTTAFEKAFSKNAKSISEEYFNGDNKKFKEWIRINISEYATTNRKELFAEAYVMKIRGEALPIWLDNLILEVIKNAK